MSRAPLSLAAVLLGGCWSFPDTSELATVAFDNAIVNTTTGVIATIETNLECPDGEYARIYVVYDEAITTPAPVAVVFHSSAFDYVLDPKAANPLNGTHFAGNVSRMDWSWGVRKVWETFGLHAQIDPVEDNLGTLPAALLDQGIVGIYPTNCWGDLWQNGRAEYENDIASEYIERDGGIFAWWMIRILFEQSFADIQGIDIPVDFDAQQLYLIGLGDGARAVIGLLARGGDLPTPDAILLDAPIDDLAQWGDEVPGVQDGLKRIFYNPDNPNQPDVDRWSLNEMLRSNAADDYPALWGTPRLGIVYSSSDPKVPAGNLDRIIENKLPRLVEAGNQVCLMDTRDNAHVFTNADNARARGLVDWMLGGDTPSDCVTPTGN